MSQSTNSTSQRIVPAPRFTFLVLIGVPILVCAVVGIYLDRTSTLDQPDLFWPLFTASLIGTFVGAVPLFHCANGSIWKLLLLVSMTLVVWRVAYFPNMVFAGFLASLAEVALYAWNPHIVVIYPVFLIAIFGLHALGLWFLSHAFRTAEVTIRCHRFKIPRWLIGMIGAPMLVVAGLVSFTSAEDWHLLPDRPAQVTEALPEYKPPQANPYLPRLGESDRPLSQRVLLLCAGLTYAYIPHSPWAIIVKGTLEDQMNTTPVAGSQQRVREHYLAYLVAHRALHGTR